MQALNKCILEYVKNMYYLTPHSAVFLIPKHIIKLQINLFTIDDTRGSNSVSK